MKMLKRSRAFALVMAVALILSGFAGGNVSSAAVKATLKFKKTSVSLKAGKSTTLTITQKNVKKIKSTKWVTSNQKVAKVSKKGKVTAVKAGKATITATVKYVAKGTAKARKKLLRCKVTVTKASTKKDSTQAPAASPSTAAAVSAASAAPVPAPSDGAAVPEVTVAPVQAANVKADGKLDDTNLTDEHTSRYGATTMDNGIMRTNLSAQDITKGMSLGWNIGNSLEQTGAGSTETMTAEEVAALTDEDWVKAYETNAGNPVSTQTMISGLKRYGINTIRIPVAWSNMMTVEPQADGTNYYKISDAYFNRVEEVINYCLNEEMYVVINIHWDGQWWGMFGDADQSVRDQAWKKYTDMWTQIAERYAEYSDRLIFEGANEELGERLNDNWQGDGGSRGVLTAEETYALTNEINQKFVDIVRESGVNADGVKNNNYYRFLLIPGYDTNLHQTCGDKYSDKVKKNNDALTYTMPEDVEENGINRLFVSIHYYDPLGWGIAKTAASYDTPKGISNYVDTWGSEEDYAAMQEDFDAVKEAYIDKGYGVIFGEFGVVSMNKDGIPDYFRQFFKSCQEIGCVPIMWDEGGIVVRTGKDNKKYAYFIYEDIGNVFLELTGSTVELMDGAKKAQTMTGKPENLVSENQDPLVVGVWEGDFMRSSSGSGAVNLEEIKKVFGEDFVFTSGNNSSAGNFKTKSITLMPGFEDLTMKATGNNGNWHCHFTISDWSRLKEPGIRITMHDDLISKSAQLQLVYSDGLWDGDKDNSWKYESDYAQVETVKGDTYTKEQAAALPSTVNYYVKSSSGKTEIFSDMLPKLDENLQPVLAETAWQEKALKLKPKYLEDNPVILITTNDYLGVDFTKVEIVDLAYNADGSEFTGAE